MQPLHRYFSRKTMAELLRPALILAIALVYALRLKGGRWRDPEVLEVVMAE